MFQKNLYITFFEYFNCARVSQNKLTKCVITSKVDSFPFDLSRSISKEKNREFLLKNYFSIYTLYKKFVDQYNKLNQLNVLFVCNK